MMSTTFYQLNHGWNAEPNSPAPKAWWDGVNLILTFLLNPYQFSNYNRGDVGQITFTNCSRYRFGMLNDEGWYRDQGRFQGVAHQWGYFYEVHGDLRLKAIPNDWQIRAESTADMTHFLFYFRDEDFECDAHSWPLSVIKA